MATFVSVANGQSVSSAFPVRGDRPLALYVASHTAIGWHVAYSPDSGATFVRAAGVGAAGSSVWSGGVAGVFPVEYPLGSLARIETSAAVSATTSVRVVELNRR